MKKILFSIVFSFIFYYCFGQLSSNDIRHASGKGPYPIYVSVQAGLASTKNTFRDFSAAYTKEIDINNKKVLGGFEANLGVAINEDHFLWIPNFRVKRASVELGYRHLYRNFSVSGGRWLHLQEEVLSLRFGMRGNIIYPITYQIQTGPTLHNFVTAREISDSNGNAKRVRMGSGLFEGKSEEYTSRKFPSGWEFRARLMILDPAGTDGGMGFFFEYRYLYTFGGEKGNKRNLRPLYEEFLGASADDLQSWNYSSFSIGMIVPFAIRIK